MAILGVIGGLGPMATAYFMQLVTSMTDAATDQEHLRMVVYSAPDIPDRTRYILGKSSESPLPGILDAGLKLKSIGAEVIAIPCVTAHYFQQEIEQGLGVHTLNAVSGTTEMLAEHGIKTVGLMATEGTVQSGLFQREFDKQGLTLITPGSEDQELVTSLIYNDVKQGREPDMDAFRRVKEGLVKRGAEAVILGCTELSVIKRDYDTGDGTLDVMEVLAAMSIEACGKQLKNELVIKTCLGEIR